MSISIISTDIAVEEENSIIILELNDSIEISEISNIQVAESQEIKVISE